MRSGRGDHAKSHTRPGEVQTKTATVMHHLTGYETDEDDKEDANSEDENAIDEEENTAHVDTPENGG